MKLNATLAPTTIVDLPYPGIMRNDRFQYSGPAIKSNAVLTKNETDKKNT